MLLSDDVLGASVGPAARQTGTSFLSLSYGLQQFSIRQVCQLSLVL